ncbi:3-oxo-5a-steroid 4- dehydrogenase [Yamadazyma tenuis]|uniref:3-oxo-5-alpha-steroid 4-dehydrogenase C-terminal domain-containing protein n=1 Tax=Candida tenuis (strain ATCC 10573 / BCRC 21748 / CBS 615 / JCM 9827 / NBRC 10315 / NRRL Y-1498 / VKM Y-70) TaxID=590646 RepID=G3B8K2_CANTC|nr:uncharacterized protein CANTEDRAFT_108493 [Yamadazyma tenuis ATCC 10573]EGV61752.1 hypothetical protein CANTEDRAFT_108493 [Yamadazyma tenuis ATCC 10573]WEJ92981.1 3-oxo-5a-steroid 4- dehydrogenase [Yamadazyma tenuis]
MSLQLDIKSRSKSIKSVSTDEFSPISFTNDVIELISKESGLTKNRIRLTVEQDGKRVPLEINKQLKVYNITGDTELQVKDLGPQISWRGVYLVEYLGPIVLHSVFFYGFRSFFGDFKITTTQLVLYNLSLLHFTKREYETLFVHKFSNATMPVSNIFKNCGHYWLLNGVMCSVFVYGPPFLHHSKNPIVRLLFRTNDLSADWVILLSLVFVFFEGANYVTHRNLSLIRERDPKNYQIPYGFGFNWVTCPNYFFEVMAFLTLGVMSGNWSYFVFILVGGVQMYVWAVGKHKRYLKTFGNEYRKLNRKVMIPYLL